MTLGGDSLFLLFVELELGIENQKFIHLSHLMNMQP